LLVSIWFAFNLPPSRNFRPSAVDLKSVWTKVRSAATDPGLFPIFAIAFLLMGSFGSLYNYIAFLLMNAPYNLSHGQVGWIFLLYLVGTVSSTWMGRMADSIGQTRVLSLGLACQVAGALITLAPGLGIKILGVAVFTFGFFGAHATASSWVGARSGALKATAATLYLLSYYCGTSVGGWVGGYFWIHLGWAGVVLMGTLFLGAAQVLTLRAGRART
jgi:YNFM family putative membrane transporter